MVSILGKILYNFFLYKKGVYLKIGQVLSNQHTLFSKEFIDELVHLQHNIPYDITQKEYDDILSNIDVRITDISMVESGSVAVILKGRYNDKDVAIKVVKPGTYELITKQNEWIKYSLACIPSYYNKKLILKKWEVVYESILSQLDMRQEADNIAHFHEISSYVIIPNVYSEFTTSNMVVMDWIEGVPMTHIDDYNFDVDTKQTLGSYFSTFLKESYDSNKFHMDLHPGNILITKDNKLAVIDFGMVFHMDSEDKSKVLLMMINKIVEDDFEGFVKIFSDTYIPNGNVKLQNDILKLCKQESDNMTDNPYVFLNGLYTLCEKENIEINNEFADFEFSLLIAKDTFLKLWEMNKTDFFILIS